MYETIREPTDYARIFDEADKKAEAFRAQIKAESQTSVATTLKSRESSHGNYYFQSALAHMLKVQIRCTPGYDMLESDMKESLDMICVKISRIIHGNCNEPDHWHDIAGYAQLVQNRLKGLPSNGAAIGNVPPSCGPWSQPSCEGTTCEKAAPQSQTYSATTRPLSQGAAGRDTRG